MTANRVGCGLAIAGGMAIAAATLFPTPGSPRVPHFCLVCGPLGGVDAVLNVLLFIPLGLGLGIRKTRLTTALLLVVLTTAFVELLQLEVIVGRAATLGDLVMNTAGGLLGYTVGGRWKSLVFPEERGRRWLLATAAFFFAAMMTFTGFSLQSSPTRGFLFGHLTRGYGVEKPYPGSVRSATIGECAVTNRTADSSCIYDALIRGDSVSVEIGTRGTSPTAAAILRVVDGAQNEIVSLGGDRDRAIFHARTRGAAMGFPAYRFALDSVFTLAAPSEVHLAGAFAPSGATIRSSSSGRSRRLDARLGPSSGWRLFIPLRYYDDGSPVTDTIGAVWLALLLVPAGFWISRSTMSALLLVPAVSGALLICPLLFRTAPPSILEFLACAAGIGIGAWARTRIERVDDSLPSSHDSTGRG
jgi:hypothetical protein